MFNNKLLEMRYKKVILTAAKKFIPCSSRAAVSVQALVRLSDRHAATRHALGAKLPVPISRMRDRWIMHWRMDGCISRSTGRPADERSLLALRRGSHGGLRAIYGRACRTDATRPTDRRPRRPLTMLRPLVTAPILRDCNKGYRLRCSRTLSLVRSYGWLGLLGLLYNAIEYIILPLAL